MARAVVSNGTGKSTGYPVSRGSLFLLLLGVLLTRSGNATAPAHATSAVHTPIQSSGPAVSGTIRASMPPGDALYRDLDRELAALMTREGPTRH
jgi:hypothetical protein